MFLMRDGRFSLPDAGMRDDSPGIGRREHMNGTPMRGSRAIDELLQQAVSGGVAPGIVAGVTTRDGTVYQGACGRLGLASDKAVAFDSLFWIASMTKAITSIAAMQLVERGLLSLNGPISDIVPELRAPRILEGFDGNGQPRLRPARIPITLSHLLSHSSGFAEDVWHEDIVRYLAATGTPGGATGKRAAIDIPLLFEPGAAWQYGISHDWVAQAIERASGQRLDDYFAEHIFGPLGMADTTYLPTPAQERRLAVVHSRLEDNSLTPFPRAIPTQREFVSGGGVLLSTAGDYLAFMRMLLGAGDFEGKSILRAETVRGLDANQTGSLPVSALDPTNPVMSNKVAMLPDTRKCWGLGFMVNLEDLPTGRRANSLSWAGLGNTYYWIDPESGVAGVLLTQILPFADKAVMDLFTAFEIAVYDALDQGMV